MVTLFCYYGVERAARFHCEAKLLSRKKDCDCMMQMRNDAPDGDGDDAADNKYDWRNSRKHEPVDFWEEQDRKKE